MNVKSLKVCLTCLSCDRELYPVPQLESLLEAVDVSLIYKDNGICWECKTIMYNFLKFKTQVKEAQEILTNNRNVMKSLSRLKIANNTTNIIYNHCDSITIKTEAESIKQEINDDINETVDSDIKSVRLSNLYKPEECLKDEKKSLGSPVETEEFDNRVEISIKMEEHKEKYTMIMSTKEDLLKIKDKKRSHPNYQKVPFKCDECVLGFNEKKTFDIHMKKKHDKSIGEHCCDICYTRFPMLGTLERHKRNHYINFKCNLCKYETKSLSAMESHCKLKHINDRFGDIHCEQCNNISKTPEDMTEHIKKYHSLLCNICGDKFSARDTLRRHKSRMHTTKREFMCDQCKKTFKNKHHLETHMVSHNSSLAKKLAYCQSCNVQYKNIYKYRQHLKSSANHSENLFTCLHCNKNFTTKASLQRHHNFYHLKKSGYICNTCDKSFISRSRLTNHKQVHHGDTRIRNHSCEICDKKFYDVRTLFHHKKIHSDLRTYMCEDCGDTFKQSASLYTHIRLVHKMLKKIK